MAYMKDLFERWISKTTRSNGEAYERATINNYINVIKGFCSKLKGLEIPTTDLFEIDSLADFMKICEVIKAHPEFKSINDSYHRSFSSGLMAYKKFLESLDINEKAFTTWLRNYREPQYRESTINRYLTALKRAEERLEIRLSASIFSIDSRDLFESVVQEIRTAPQYEFVNKKYGNGDLSAALTAYGKYLDSKSLDDKKWWPSQEEYPLNLTKEDWKKYLLEVELPQHPSPMKMLKGMMELGGEASCKWLSDMYGGHPSVYTSCAMNLGRRVKKFFKLPACIDGEQERYFVFPFVGKHQGGTEDNYVYRIRPELKAALQEIDLSNIDPYYETEQKMGIFDSWEIIDENTAIKRCDKSFFAYKESGIPKGICWFFGAEEMRNGKNKTIKIQYCGTEYSGNIKTDPTDSCRVRISWSSELGKQFEHYNVPDATATFKKIAEDTYEVFMKDGEKEMTVKEKVDSIKAYIAAEGLHYEGDLIENFYLSLKSKPFVILAGTSGTGKTRLVKLFAKAIGAKIKLVPVRPDWSDSSDLFGYTDLSNGFHPGAIIDFVKQAQVDKDTPYFLCLDEMNLARVEYYLSDFLSVIETRDRNADGTIKTDSLVDENFFKTDEVRAKYSPLYIPENLYIIGTVNMDETTFPFSKKVLDRANTIEFSYVNLMNKFAADGQAVPMQLDNSFLKTEFLYLRDCEDQELIDTVCCTLEELNQILVKANLHVGYRVRDEISFYMMNNKKAELLAEDVAFDHEIMQKILPRVQGSSASIKKALSELFIKCAGDYTGFSGAAAYEQMDSYLESKNCKYPNSAKKIAFMMRRYEEDGFTSYWI